MFESHYPTKAEGQNHWLFLSLASPTYDIYLSKYCLAQLIFINMISLS